MQEDLIAVSRFLDYPSGFNMLSSAEEKMLDMASGLGGDLRRYMLYLGMLCTYLPSEVINREHP